MDRATLEWIGTRVAEDVVQQLRMAHMQQSGIMNGHMSVCNRVLELYTAVHELRAAAVREGVEAARHRKQQKEALAEVKTQIDQMKRRDAEMKVRIKSLQRQEKKEMLADEKWELMKNQVKDVMIQMKEIHEELREIRGHKTEQTTTVTTTTRVTGSSSSDRSEEGLGVDRWEAYYADQTRRFLEAQWSRMTLKIIRRLETKSAC